MTNKQTKPNNKQQQINKQSITIAVVLHNNILVYIFIYVYRHYNRCLISLLQVPKYSVVVVVVVDAVVGVAVHVVVAL